MTRTHTLPRILRFTAFAGVALIGMAACSSETNKTSVEDLTTIDVSIPTDISLPPGVTLPISDDCQAIYAQFVAAMTSAYLPQAQQLDYDQVFGDVSENIPADLQDDLLIMSAAFQEYGAILAANGNDSSKPEVQAAIQSLATDEVNAASNNLQDYFETACPGVG